MWEYISNLCTSFTSSFFPLVHFKETGLFYSSSVQMLTSLDCSPAFITTILLSISISIAIATSTALIFLLHLLQELLPLHIHSVLCVCVTALFFHASWHFLPEFFPQKWQLTLAFNRTDLLLVRSRVVPSRILYPLLRLRSICLYVRLKPSCNCRLYYQQTTTWGVVIAVSSCSGCFTKQSNAAPLVAPSTLCGFAKIVVKIEFH